MTTARRTTTRVAAPVPRTRTKWQLKRDAALRDAGFTKRDVWNDLRRTLRADAPSESSVRAVLDGRYGDPRVQEAFARLVEPDPAKRAKLIGRLFPDSEPVYRGPMPGTGTR